jgi:hypothetical protein
MPLNAFTHASVHCTVQNKDSTLSVGVNERGQLVVEKAVVLPLARGTGWLKSPGTRCEHIVKV